MKTRTTAILIATISAVIAAYAVAAWLTVLPLIPWASIHWALFGLCSALLWVMTTAYAWQKWNTWLGMKPKPWSRIGWAAGVTLWALWYFGTALACALRYYLGG